MMIPHAVCGRRKSVSIPLLLLIALLAYAPRARAEPGSARPESVMERAHFFVGVKAAPVITTWWLGDLDARTRPGFLFAISLGAIFLSGVEVAFDVAPMTWAPWIIGEDTVASVVGHFTVGYHVPLSRSARLYWPLRLGIGAMGANVKGRYSVHSHYVWSLKADLLGIELERARFTFEANLPSVQYLDGGATDPRDPVNTSSQMYCILLSFGVRYHVP